MEVADSCFSLCIEIHKDASNDFLKFPSQESSFKQGMFTRQKFRSLADQLTFQLLTNRCPFIELYSNEINQMVKIYYQYLAELI